MGRPSKFTVERRERYLAALRLGAFPETAAGHAGWSAATMYRILRGTSPDHVAFREDVRRVETELELRLAGTVTQAAFGDARLALSLLERRFGERWGRRAALVAVERGPGPGAARSAPVVVLEPAVVEAAVPLLLESRFGEAVKPAAAARVSRFARSAGEEPGG